MIIQQLSVFLENRPGTLVEVLSVLKERGINLRALALADTADFGIMRIIVHEPDQVERILHEAGFTVRITLVMAIDMQDHPGGLFSPVATLGAAGINIEYMYAFAANSDQGAKVILKVDDVERAETIMAENGSGADPGKPSYW